MKNNSKRFFCLIVTVCMLVSVLGINAIAIDNEQAISKKGFTGARSHDDYIAEKFSLKSENLTNAQIQNRSAKLAYSESIKNSGVSTMAAAAPYWDYTNNGYVVYGQINNYYCGPASVRGVLMYKNGSSPTQDQIAAGCGTTSSAGTYLAPMVSYMNSKLTSTYYTQQNNASASDMRNYLWSAIQYDDPPIVGFACSISNGWKYDSGGHFVVINGVRSDWEMFNLADPLILYLGLTGSFYDKSGTDLYNAYNSVNIGLCW